MSMAYRFAEFALRPAGTADFELAKAWTLADPYHSRTTRPDFWLTQSEAVNCYLLEDEAGPVFFFRIEMRGSACQIYIQFSPGQAIMQARTRRGIREGFRWLEKMLSESGFEAYYFHSHSPQLIFFCTRRLGFEWEGTRLHRTIREAGDGRAERKEAQPVAG